MRSTEEIMNDGYKYLLEELGVIETEIFISTLLRERFDYTEWRKDKFDDMSLEELGRQAAEYSKKLHANDDK